MTQNAIPEANHINQYERLQPTFLQIYDLTVRLGKTHLVREVTTTFEPDTATAIIGPSASGSVLLRALVGRQHGSMTGEALLNGVSRQPEQLRKIVAFLPVEPILFAELTVKQAIYYALLLRSPTNPSKHARFARADVVIERFGLTGVQDQRIGDIERPSLSKGQIRRVANAIEFLSLRPLLFAEQPTDSLDSAGAKSIVDAMVIASTVEGRTAVATLQQPSWALINAFHRLLVLGSCGRVIFDGLPNRLIGYMEERGAPTPALVQAADHIIAVLSRESSERWSEMWTFSEDSAKIRQAQDKLLAMLLLDDTKQIHPLRIRTRANKLTKQYNLTYFEQYRLLLLRMIHLCLANSSHAPLIYETFFSMVLVVGFFAFAVTDASTAVTRFASVLTFQLVLTPGMMMTTNELNIIKREYHGGCYALVPYFLAELTLAFINSLLLALLLVVLLHMGVWIQFDSLITLKWIAAAVLHLVTSIIFGRVLGGLAKYGRIGIQAVIASVSTAMLMSGARPSPLLPSGTKIMPDQFPNFLYWVANTLRQGTDLENHSFTVENGLGLIWRDGASTYFLAQSAWLLLVCIASFTVTQYRMYANSQPATKRLRIDLGECLQPYFVRLNEFDIEKGSGDVAHETRMLTEFWGKDYGTWVSPRVTITTKNLSYWHPDTRPGLPKGPAFQAISLHFESGKPCVIVGPSGCGKTSLLSVLASRAHGKTTGTICVNGKQQLDAKRARFSVSYTPQDTEMLIPELTVIETLWFRAQLHCPSNWSKARRSLRLIEIARTLGLQDDFHSIVGSSEHSNISPGLRRRVSFAMDLFAQRPIMLVDSPTTGLNAREAWAIVETIVLLSRTQHRTVVCAVAQPSWAMLEMFDVLVIMAHGKVTFSGKPSDLSTFYERCGASLSMSKGEMIEHAVDGALNTLDANEHAPSMWAAKWELFLKVDALTNYPPTCDHVESTEHFEGTYTASFDDQFCLILKQLFRAVTRHWDLYVASAVCALLAVIDGVAFRNVRHSPQHAGFACAMMALTPTFSMLGMATLHAKILRAFFQREITNGVCTLRVVVAAYGTLLVCISFFLSAVVMGIWWYIVDIPIIRWRIVNALTASGLCASIFAGWAAIFAMSTRSELRASQRLGPIFCILILTSGCFAFKRSIQSILRWTLTALPSSSTVMVVLYCCFGHVSDDDEEAQAILTQFDVPAISYSTLSFSIGEILLTGSIGFIIAYIKLGFLGSNF